MVTHTRSEAIRMNQAQTTKGQQMEETVAVQEESVVDGPYSWVILLVAFLLNFTMNATAGGMGVIMVEWMHYFNVKPSVIFWIGGILVSIGFLLSFIIGWLVKRFGCRLTGCLASVFAAISLILTSFAQSIAALYVTYGVLLGICVAFYWNIASVIVQQYFEKRRALAQGTLMAGLSGGLFMWPPITRYMIDIYGWRGAMLLHAGIQLHGVVLCSLIRPFPMSQQKTYTYRPIYHKPSTQQQNLSTEQTVTCDYNEVVNKLEQNCASEHINGRVGSDTLVKEEQSTGMESLTFELQDESQESGYKTITQPGQNTKNPCCSSGSRCLRALFKILVIFPHYALYMLAVTLVQTGNVMPYTLTPARADALGIDKHLGALIVTISAGVSGVCRILCGLFADHPAINRLVFCGLAGLFGGTLTAISSALNTFLSLAVIFGVIAVPSAAYMATFGSAGVDIVGKKYVQQSVGLMSVAFGVAQLSTFLGTGWLNDLLGDPKYAFLVFGVLEAVGGIAFLGVYFVDRRFKRHTVAVPTTETT